MSFFPPRKPVYSTPLPMFVIIWRHAVPVCVCVRGWGHPRREKIIILSV